MSKSKIEKVFMDSDNKKYGDYRDHLSDKWGDNNGYCPQRPEWGLPLNPAYPLPYTPVKREIDRAEKIRCEAEELLEEANEKFKAVEEDAKKLKRQKDALEAKEKKLKIEEDILKKERDIIEKAKKELADKEKELAEKEKKLEERERVIAPPLSQEEVKDLEA